MNTKIVAGMLLGVCLGLVSVGDAGAASSRYVLDTRPIKGDEENKTVSLRDTKTGRTLWTRKIMDPHASWSKDRRAVAVEGNGKPWVWREGERLREFGFPLGRDFSGESYSFDYSMGCVWSPDKSRLLMRFGASGSSMVGDNGIGALFCLQLGPKRSSRWTSVAYNVTDMKWRDNRTVVYDALDLNERMEGTVKSYVWRTR